ncbi:Sulfotransferase family protein [Alteromonadaceae bacterium Bs31]|nr:Sulfotransferase family protein [Alteromonadaceae bacterium Bs31]
MHKPGQHKRGFIHKSVIMGRCNAGPTEGISVLLFAIYLSFLQCFLFAGRLCPSLPLAGKRKIPLRLLIFLAVWLLSGLLALLHAIGFVFDELLFWRYRNIRVKATFIVGIPRSGTTWLHRVMAADKRYTSLTLWESILAPSISERYFYSAMARLLSPLGSAAGAVSAKLLANFDAIHALRLNEPEEDFLLFAPVHGCFLGVLLCPESPYYWQFAYFDQQLSVRLRRAYMSYYQRCLQKHLFFHGANRQLLSKNPSFTPMIESLRKQFPDASFIACVRNPQEAVASQLSSLQPAMKFLGYNQLSKSFCSQLTQMLRHYYQEIALKRRRELIIVDFVELCDHLEDLLIAIYRKMEQPISEEYALELKRFSDKGRRYKSKHTYKLEQFGLKENEISTKFKACWPFDTSIMKTIKP